MSKNVESACTKICKNLRKFTFFWYSGEIWKITWLKLLGMKNNCLIRCEMCPTLNFNG